MDPIIYMGYGYTFNDIDMDNLTDSQKEAFDMLTENDYFNDINGTPLVENSLINAWQVEACESTFIYIPDISRINDWPLPIKSYTKKEANNLLEDYTRKMFNAVVDNSDLNDMNQYFDRKLTKDKIKELLNAIVDKINIPKVAQEQSYVDYD